MTSSPADFFKPSTDRSGGAAAAAVAWRDLLLVLAAALWWRVLFFNGPFGSDDGTYLSRALDVANGTWSSANYNGALRYGFNLPAGILMRLFGTSIFVANLWPLLCSLAEVALVFWLLHTLQGRSAALLGGLLLGAAPLHIAVATRIHADPVVSFFLTAAFVAVFAALRRGSAWWCAIAGLCLGGVYWAKELAPVTYFAFLPLLWYFRRNWAGVVWTLAGLGVALAANGLLMLWIAGDPFHPVKVVMGALNRNFIDGGDGEDSPLYYLRYLFVDPRHVGLLGLLAALGLVDWIRRSSSATGHQVVPEPGRGFVMLWLLGLLLVLSVFPVSLSPLRFTMKQSNYVTLFLAPLVIMASLALERWPPRLRWAAASFTIGAGLLLGALQQADYRVFTANSKAIAQTMTGRTDVLLIGNINHRNIASIWNSVTGQPVPVISFSDAMADPAGFAKQVSGVSEVWAAIDPQNASWGRGAMAMTRPLPCWRLLADVVPAELGWGNQLASGLSTLATSLPGALAAKAAAVLQGLAAPGLARIYSVPEGQLWCGSDPAKLLELPGQTR